MLRAPAPLALVPRPPATTTTTTTLNTPSPPLPNLRRALDALPTSLSTAVESEVGPLLHPLLLQGVVSTVHRSLSQQRVVLDCAALQDLNSSTTSVSLVDTIITECLDHHKNPRLVNWIVDSAKRSEAIDHVIKLRGYMGERNGNYVRSEFQVLVTFFMECLGIPNEPRLYLNDVCRNLKTALELGGIGPELNNAARSVIRACYGVRDVTNQYSHPPARPMGDADMHELCGLFQALGSAMPTIAAEFCRLPTPSHLALAASSTPQVISPSSVNDARVAAVSRRQLASTQSCFGATASSNGDENATAWRLARGSRAPSRPPPGFAKTAAVLPLARFVPTGAELEKAANFQLYYNRPRHLPQETDKTRSTMFNRMVRHAKLVPKATLCSFNTDHDAACQKSHSYLEVMRYNPLFKLFICRQSNHFDRDDIVENNVCVGAHVNTGIDFEAIVRAKKMGCIDGDKCDNTKCLRSHSFEEMCWFNPRYNTTKCDFEAEGRCSYQSFECPFAHSDEPLRDWNNDSDYVGKTGPMLFVERTHKALTDALETLRYMSQRVERTGQPHFHNSF